MGKEGVERQDLQHLNLQKGLIFVSRLLNVILFCYFTIFHSIIFYYFQTV